MIIYIKKPTAKVVPLNVDLSMTFLNIKNMVYQHDRLCEPRRIKIMFNGRECWNPVMLCDYNIKKDDCLYMMWIRMAL